MRHTFSTSLSRSIPCFVSNKENHFLVFTSTKNKNNVSISFLIEHNQLISSGNEHWICGVLNSRQAKQCGLCGQRIGVGKTPNCLFGRSSWELMTPKIGTHVLSSKLFILFFYPSYFLYCSCNKWPIQAQGRSQVKETVWGNATVDAIIRMCCLQADKSRCLPLANTRLLRWEKFALD